MHRFSCAGAACIAGFRVKQLYLALAGCSTQLLERLAWARLPAALAPAAICQNANCMGQFPNSVSAAHCDSGQYGWPGLLPRCRYTQLAGAGSRRSSKGG